MKKYSILFMLLISFSGNLFSQDIDIDQISEDVDRVITRDSIKVVKKDKMQKIWNNRFIIPPAFEGALYVGATSMAGNDYDSYFPKTKFEIGYFDNSANYIGLQLATQKSNLIYVDDYDELNDQIWNFIYGRAFTSNGGIMDAFFLKIAIGYHTYNYDATESFGAFYDIGDDFYADIGIRMFLFDLGGFGIIPEVNVDIKGNMSYGLGIGIDL